MAGALVAVGVLDAAVAFGDGRLRAGVRDDVRVVVAHALEDEVADTIGRDGRDVRDVDRSRARRSTHSNSSSECGSSTVPRIVSPMLVATPPGNRPLTPMPHGAGSSRRLSVYPTAANFERGGARSRGRQLVGHRRRPVDVEVDDRHCHAGRAARSSDARADAAATARDHRDLAVEHLHQSSRLRTCAAAGSLADSTRDLNETRQTSFAAPRGTRTLGSARRNDRLRV